MIIYSVTVEVDAGIGLEWLAWMRETHIPEVLATGCFSGCQIAERHEPTSPAGSVTYVLDYSSPSPAELARYRERFAPALQQAHTARYGTRARANRTVRTLISRIPDRE